MAELKIESMCSSCVEKPSKFIYEKRSFCSNRCVVAEFGRPKLAADAVLLYTIDTGNDNPSVDFYGCTEKAKERYERGLSKAILVTSKKPVKAVYTHNQGALPREWR